VWRAGLRIALIALAGAAVAPALASARPVDPAPSRLQVQGVEYQLLLSRQKLRPGDAIVQFVNAGEDSHNLRLQRIDSSGAPLGPELGLGEVEPGAYENLAAHLHRGSTYELWCSVKDHRARGMDATLRTKRHRHRGR
jgi:hypothetical protein